MSDPRSFRCPRTEGPCTEEQCNYKATGCCARQEQEDSASQAREAEEEREKERNRLNKEARVADGKRRYQVRKEREAERLLEALKDLDF